MIIKDHKGIYELRVDKARRIVYEKIMGTLSGEDYTRMTDDYINKIIPYLGSGDWMKLCDVRKSKPSILNTPGHISGELNRLLPWGFKGGAVLVDSATLKMQINVGARNIVEPNYFDTEEDADSWLKEQGF